MECPLLARSGLVDWSEGLAVSEMRNLAIIFTVNKHINKIIDVLINGEKVRGEGQ